MSFSLTLTDARTIVRYFAHNARSTAMYPDALIDFAIQATCDLVVREAYLLLHIATIPLTSGNMSLPSPPTNFRPDRSARAYLVGANVVVDFGWGGYAGDAGAWPEYTVIGQVDPDPAYGVEYNPRRSELLITEFTALLDLSLGVVRSGQPTKMAFNTQTASGIVYPTPDQNYTLTLAWQNQFTQWTAGGASGAITFNIPDDYMRDILMNAVPEQMQYSEQDHRYISVGMRPNTEAVIARLRGKGNLGSQSIPVSLRG